MLVDAVTGRVLHSQSAPGARGPATALLSENTAVVQLWDASSARFTVTSLEAYDATPRPPFSVSALLDTLLNPNATAPWSSLAPPPLEVGGFTPEFTAEFALGFMPWFPMAFGSLCSGDVCSLRAG